MKAPWSWGLARQLFSVDALTRRAWVRICPTMLFFNKVENRWSREEKFGSKRRQPAAVNQRRVRRWRGKNWIRTRALRNHRRLRLTVRLETSGATAKSHGWTYISMDEGKKHKKKKEDGSDTQV